MYVDLNLLGREEWGKSRASPRLLQFVQVVVQGRDTFLKTLTFACLHHNVTGLGSRGHGVSWEDLPVVKHTLWEGLATGVGTKVCSETWRWKEQSWFQILHYIL